MSKIDAKFYLVVRLAWCLWVLCGSWVAGLAAIFILWLMRVSSFLLVVLAQLVILPFVGLFNFNGEFDPGSGRTLAACLTHASRTMMTGLALSD